MPRIVFAPSKFNMPKLAQQNYICLELYLLPLREQIQYLNTIPQIPLMQLAINGELNGYIAQVTCFNTIVHMMLENE